MDSLNLLHAVHAAYRPELSTSAYLRAVAEVLVRELPADGVSGCLWVAETGQREFFTVGAAGPQLQQAPARETLQTAVDQYADTVSLRPVPAGADHGWLLLTTTLSVQPATALGLLCQISAQHTLVNQHQMLKALQLVALVLRHHGGCSTSAATQPFAGHTSPANSPTAPVPPATTTALSDSRGLTWGERDLWQACFSAYGLDEICFAVANEGRQWLGSERVSVLTRRGTGLRLRAMSGQATWERRSPAVQYLEQLAQRCLPLGSVVAYPDDEELPPQIMTACESYSTVSQARSLYVVPLMAPPTATDPSRDGGEPQESPAVGVLVIEYGDGLPADPTTRAARRDAIDRLALPAGFAIRNAPTTSPLTHSWRRLAGPNSASQHRLARWGLVAGSLIMLLLAAAVLRTDLQVYADGVLRPVDRRQVYAQTEGLVETIHVRHGQQVAVGDPLITLENPELSRQIANVLGQIQAAKQRLSDLDALRLAETPLSTTPAEAPHRLTTEYRQVSQQLQNLQLQYDMMQTQQESLHVRSPIAGTVVTWDVEKRWQARPVNRGDELLTIMSAGGPWELEVSVADREAGPMIAAFREQKTPLSLKYSLGTQPETQYMTSVTSIAEAAQYDPELGQIVAVTAQIPAGQIAEPRMGAEVRAKIACGRVSWAYVALRDLIRFVRTQVIFPWT